MSLAKAERAFKDFHGEAPREVVTIPLPDSDVAAWHLGTVEQIAYRTRRDGKASRYLHQFQDGTGPEIGVDRNGQAILTGGSYGVTDRGFEDDDPMHNLLLVNPHKRGEPAKAAKKMARKSTPHRNSKGRFVKRSAARKTYASNPVRRKSHRRSSSRGSSNVPVVVVTPSSTSGRSVKRKRYARNPIGGRSRGGKGGLDIAHMLVPAAMQALGAIGTSVAFGAIESSLPANLTTGQVKGATKAVTGLVVGYVIAKFVNKSMGQNFALGALTIGAYDWLTQFVPAGLPMGAMYRSNMGAMIQAPMGAMYRNNMGAMIRTPMHMNGLGWATAANVTHLNGARRQEMSQGYAH